jgi:hypothetical protein
MATGLAASAAIAAPPPGKGKPEAPGKPATAGKPSTTGSTCKPMVTVVLKGTIDTASASSLSMDVTSANRWGRAYVPGAGLTTVGVENAKVRRNGNTTPAADLLKGDRVLVQARACKADLLATGTPPTLTAVRVVAHPAKA